MACSASPKPPAHEYSLKLSSSQQLTARRTAAGAVTWDTLQVVTVQNEGPASFRYLLESTVPWLGFSRPPAGVLAPGQAVAIELAIDPAATPAAGGTHIGQLRVLNAFTFHEELRLPVAWSADERRPGAAAASRASPASGVALDTIEQDGQRPLEVHVSSSAGDDGFDGLSPRSPKRTIAAGVALLRDGHPDRLLLQRGDTFQGGLGNWTKSGRSAEPMVVTSYGTAPEPPRLLTGTGSGVTVHGAGSGVRDVAFVGLDFVPQTYDGTNGAPNGVSLLAPCQRIRFENCSFRRYFVNVVLQGNHRDLTLRRCSIVDAFTKGTNHAQGLYIDGVDGCVIEECLIDHNGWRRDVPGCEPTVFRHNVYVQFNCRNVALRGNIIARGASHGVQLRCGGTVEDNLFVQNAIGLLVGWHGKEGGAGRSARIAGNVFLDGRDISDQQLRGWGVELVDVGTVELERNVIAWNKSGGDPWAIRLETVGVPIERARIRRNVVYNWGAGLRVSGERIRGLELSDNVFQEHTRKNPLVVLPRGMSLESRGNVFFSAAPEVAWMQRDGDLSLVEWRRAVGDVGSRAEREERAESVPWPGSNGTQAPSWNQALEAFLAQSRGMANDAPGRPTGASVARAVRGVFGVGDE